MDKVRKINQEITDYANRQLEIDATFQLDMQVESIQQAEFDGIAEPHPEILDRWTGEFDYLHNDGTFRIYR